MSLTKVIVLILLVLLFCFSEAMIRKKLKIPKPKSWKAQPINKIHKWGERLLLTVYLVFIFISSFYSHVINLGYSLFIFCVIFFSFRAWVEWKYDKESKEYAISLCACINFLITIIILLY